MELKHRRNEKKKITEYTVTVNDDELDEFKEKMTGQLDQDLLSVSRSLADIVCSMIVRRILTDLNELEK